MKINEFKKRMNELCPLELQEEWDNSGLQLDATYLGATRAEECGVNAIRSEESSIDNSTGLGDCGNAEIKKVLVALEVSDFVIDQAKALGVDMIVTHHPLFFGGFKQIVPEMLPTRYALDLIRSGISVYSAHTNFDTMEGGNNDYFGKLIGFEDIKPLGIMRTGTVGSSLVATLKSKLTHQSDNVTLESDNATQQSDSIQQSDNATQQSDSIQQSDNAAQQPYDADQKSDLPTVNDIAHHISETLGIELPKIRLIGDPSSEVKTVAWCTGAGFDFLMDNRDIGADLYISGDIKYHEAQTASEFGMNVLDVGHFGSEWIFTPNMTALMEEAFPELEIIPSNMDLDPFETLSN